MQKHCRAGGKIVAYDLPAFDASGLRIVDDLSVSIAPRQHAIRPFGLLLKPLEIKVELLRVELKFYSLARSWRNMGHGVKRMA